ncbi:TolB family protein [Capnocytophaga cynodegmi]|uniref:TolB family protein n=1 Tax=Capnocytophaga cynodegmi TaxID=28189 RepID=UPI001BB3EDBD|nr:PD40 domain-containing protein [Capnocytophaga cynodegmi]
MILLFRIMLLAFLSSCSKESESSAGAHNLNGNLFIQFTDEVSVYNLTDNKYTEKVAKVSLTNVLETYDVSWDTSKVLFTLDVQGFNHKRIVYRSISDPVTHQEVKTDEKNIHDFEYEWGDVRPLKAFISPNEKYIALQGQGYSDMPTIIIDAHKDNEVGRCDPPAGYNDWGKPVWTLDNTLYVQVGNSVYKMSPDDGYKTYQKVCSADGGGSYRVNPQGTKFAYYKDKHLWLCNIDGSNRKQITTSKTYDWASWDGEGFPTFSPDGKYIAFTSRGSRGMAWSDHDYPDGSWVGAVGGKFGYISVIPADGKLYNLDDKNSGAISLTRSGNRGIPCDGHLVWRR